MKATRGRSPSGSGVMQKRWREALTGIVPLAVAETLPPIPSVLLRVA